MMKEAKNVRHEGTNVCPPALSLLTPSLSLCYRDLNRQRMIQTNRGDIRKTVDALRDYTRILRTICSAWGLQGRRRSTYETYAEELEEIAMTFQAGIGYDYDRAVANQDCQPTCSTTAEWGKPWPVA